MGAHIQPLHDLEEGQLHPSSRGFVHLYFSNYQQASWHKLAYRIVLGLIVQPSDRTLHGSEGPAKAIPDIDNGTSLWQLTIGYHYRLHIRWIVVQLRLYNDSLVLLGLTGNIVQAYK